MKSAIAFIVVNAALIAANVLAAVVVLAGAPAVRAYGEHSVLAWMLLCFTAVTLSTGALCMVVKSISGRVVHGRA